MKGNAAFISLLAFLIPLGLLALWIAYYWDLDKNTNEYYLTGIGVFASFFIAGIALSKLAQRREGPGRYIPREEGDTGPALFTLNGCGTRFVGVWGNSRVKYHFFCLLFLPIVPGGCYNAPKNKKDGGYSYYGHARWRALEVVGIYLCWWSGAAIAIFSLLLLFKVLLLK